MTPNERKLWRVRQGTWTGIIILVLSLAAWLLTLLVRGTSSGLFLTYAYLAAMFLFTVRPNRRLLIPCTLFSAAAALGLAANTAWYASRGLAVVLGTFFTGITLPVVSELFLIGTELLGIKPKGELWTNENSS